MFDQDSSDKMFIPFYNYDEDYELNEDDYLSLYFTKHNYSNKDIIQSTDPQIEEIIIDEKKEAFTDTYKIPQDEPKDEPKDESKIDKSENSYNTDNSTKKTHPFTIKIHSITRKENGNKTQKKNIIFKIIKIKRKKKLGRIKNNLKTQYRGKHNKFTEDNIITKIKRNFIEKTRQYINTKYDLCMTAHEHKKIKNFLEKKSREEIIKISKEKNMKFFQSKLKDIFSSDVSTKCTLHEPDYNKQKIDEIFKIPEKAKEVIDILDKKVSEFYSFYSKDIEIEGFKTLKDDLTKLRKKMEERKENNIEEYLNKYQEIAQNFETITLKKRSRISTKIFIKSK